MFPGWVTLYHKTNPSIHQSILFHLCISPSGIQQSSIQMSVTAEGEELFSQSKYFRFSDQPKICYPLTQWFTLTGNTSTVQYAKHHMEGKTDLTDVEYFSLDFLFTSIMQVWSETLSILLLREGLNKRECRTRLMRKPSDYSFSLFFRDALNLGEFGGPILFCCNKNVEQHGCESSVQMIVH